MVQKLHNDGSFKTLQSEMFWFEWESSRSLALTLILTLISALSGSLNVILSEACAVRSPKHNR